jgi:hypothetical protein
MRKKWKKGEEEGGRRRRSTGEDVRKKFRDRISEWRAPPTSKRKETISLLPEEKLKLSRSFFTTTEALPTDYGTDVALRQQM